MAQHYSDRTDTVAVPDLAAYFGKGEDATWVVRGLTGNELSRCNEAAESNKQLAGAVDALASGNAKEVMEQLKVQLGLSDDVPVDVVRRITMLQLASVSPKCSLDVAIKLNDKHPIEFFQLTNAITVLTGAGSVLGKPKGSGTKTK